MHGPAGCRPRSGRTSAYQIEPLEARKLLAAVSAAWARQAMANGLQPIDWHGTHTFAEPGQWVATLDRSDARARTQIRQINHVLAGQGIHAVRRLEGDDLFLIRGDNLPIDQVRAILSAVPGYESVEPDLAQWTQATTAVTPNDPSFSSQWALNKTGAANIDAPDAWGITTGSASVVTAVIDTGVDLTHSDLAANIWTNTKEIAGDGIDNDGDGYIDDIHGYDFANWDSDPSDDNGHGTLVAGAIAEVGNNGVGGAGVNWHTSILPVKAIGANGVGQISSVIAAINYVITLKTHDGVNIRVVNYSSAGSYSASLEQAIQNLGSNGILLVAAAGNSGTNDDTAPTYPASLTEDNVISVAASDSSDNLWNGSNYGPTSVDLAAPGVSIYSTSIIITKDPNTGAITNIAESYGTVTGTSFSAPMVSGVAALAFAAAPTATVAQVKSAIITGADPIASMAGKTVSGGRLNAFNTLQQITGAVGGGLSGTYYNSANLTGSSISRIDANVNFNWGTGSPSPSITNDNFSAQWTGHIQPQYSQTYTFTTQADDGVKVIVNGQTIINRWSNAPPTGDYNGDGTVNALDFSQLASVYGKSGAAVASYDLNGDGTINAADFSILAADFGRSASPPTNSGTITLVAGQKYTITVDYYDATGPASIKLMWSSPSQPLQVIPESRLYST